MSVWLSKRETALAHLVTDGYGNRDIAILIGTTENAVKCGLYKLYQKLGFSNRVELALWYVKRQFDEQRAREHETSESFFYPSAGAYCDPLQNRNPENRIGQ
mgnify:CR=1 FL=1